ncbi:MAG TPA: FtsK/SpoIIIE domain-containing protein, partial [Streptosporangiaceae bacterium]|nr:FtsK/SpoIIIE domain-containing protein [Streptosporangiaceae bacterium]
MRIALTALTPKGPADVIVSGDDGATAGQVAEALQEAFAPKEHLASVIMHPRAAAAGTALPPSGPVLWAGGQQVPPDSPVTRALRDGAVVTTIERAAAATSLAEPGGVAELRVISGPDAGTVHRLGPGATTIGSGPGCQVRLLTPGVPAHAATITVAWGLSEPSLEPAGAPAQLVLDGRPVTGACSWPFGGVVRVATAVLQLMRPETPDAHLSPVDGGLAYHRPPRFRADLKPVKIEVPAEPKKGHGNGVTMLLSAAVPMVMGGVMVYVTGQWLYSLFMLMMPVMVLGTWLSGSKQRGGSHHRKMRAYTRQMAEVEVELDQARAADEQRRREDAMDPAQVLLTATGPRRRLWERQADDSDTLRMRIGLFDGPAMIQLVTAKEAKPPAVPTAFCVPVSMRLATTGVLGLAGPVDASRALARWLVAQSAVLHSPRDLSIVVLAADPAAGPHWNWVRWLPHCAPRGSEDCVALVGTDLESASKRVTELVAEVTARLAKVPAEAAGGGFGGAAAEPVADSDLGPKILVVLDGARQLRRIPGMPQLLAAAKRTGIYAVCIDESARVLPEECAVVLSWDIPGQANGNHHGVRVGAGGWSVASHGAAPSAVRPFLIRGHGGAFGQGGPAMLADQVSVAWADRVARALAPVRDVSRDDSDSMIPDSARLLDLIHMPDPSADLVLMAWQKRGRTTKVPIGVSADGLYILDLSADGPHGLIAGTTGAGKSELLQTIIAVLCVANRPDAMTFVLIDYKGGSAFKDCARLPHTVGMVSDLDGHLTVRALDSLGAELKRREEMLLHAGAKDIEDYWDTRRLRPELNLEPMPRLVLIIDEFAAMVAELPDFVHGLIDIARRGRSLGVHLLLATQRPAGVVSADIRANTNLRIALRVTSSDESADVIDAPESAYIAKSTPGRCYVRSGASNLVAVQSARIGGRRPGTGPVTAGAQ